MDKYRLTIIIPHYNTPELLEKLILSIPEKEDIQVIVIDDNSTKGVEKYAEIKNTYLESVEFYRNDTGVQSAGACRNIGLSHAEGEWVLFADSDDYFLPEMYDVVKKYFDSDYDMVFFTPTSVILETGKPSDRHRHMERIIDDYLKKPTRESYLKLTVFGITSPWSRLVRRSLIEENLIRFNQSWKGNDIMFAARVGYYCRKACASHEKIYCVTRTSDSLTAHIEENAYDIQLNEIIQHHVFLREKYGDKLCNKMHSVGAYYLYLAFKRGYGIGKCLWVIKKFHENHIPIITARDFLSLVL